MSPEDVEELGHQAAKGGHVHILRHLFGFGFGRNMMTRVCGIAAAAGHLRVLDWAQSEGHVSFEDALRQACLHRC